MTFLEMYTLGQTLNDKAGSAYLPEEQFDQLAKMAYNDWIEYQYNLLEKDQEHTSRLRNLYKTFQKLNSNIIDLPVDIPTFRYLVRMNIKYRKDCNGTITYPMPSVTKAQNDDIDVLQNDPFNKGTDEEPLYIMTEAALKPALRIFSTNVPLEVNITFIREPQSIDSKNSPNTVFEQPNYIAEEIVDLAIKKHLGITENFNRVAAENGEIKQRNA